MSSDYWNEAAETLNAAAYTALHLQKLQAQLEYLAHRSPLFQQKFADADVRGSNLKDLDDLARFPFTEKHELRESQRREPPFGSHRACVPQAIKRVYSTSGTATTAPVWAKPVLPIIAIVNA